MTFTRPALAIVCVAALLAACQSNTPPAPAANASATFDVLITNGRVVDGTGSPWFRADIGIIGDRIAAIGQHRHEGQQQDGERKHRQHQVAQPWPLRRRGAARGVEMIDAEQD